MKNWQALLVAVLGLTLTLTMPLTVGAQERGEVPYTGVINNTTSHAITFYSKNSGATLIVPARSWMEYVTWVPEFRMIGYLNGEPYYCENIAVTPDQVQFMCKSYDFMAEIVQEEAPAPPQKFRKKLKPGEVEGLG